MRVCDDPKNELHRLFEKSKECWDKSVRFQGEVHCTS